MLHSHRVGEGNKQAGGVADSGFVRQDVRFFDALLRIGRILRLVVRFVLRLIFVLQAPFDLERAFDLSWG